MRGTHPRREGLDLLDGGWYADDPHEIWSWMRREAPVYHDEVVRRVGHRPLRRRPRHREGPEDLLEPAGPSAPRHGPCR